jgi:hypothetical protein
LLELDMSVDRVKKGFCFVAAIMFLCGVALGGEVSPKISIVADGKGGYTFDTGVLRGTLCPNGKLQGLTSVTHVPSGTRLDRSMGILSFYRVFTTGKRYGTGAWEWPATAKLVSDTTVHVTSPEAADRPFEMSAVYRWKDPQTIDVETTVTARKDLSKFESFLASYFDEAFPSPCVYVSENPEAGGKPGFLPAKKSFGDWQMFPRDAQVVPIIRDGRWQLEPNPVNWTIMPRLNSPLCLRRGAAKGLTVIVMAPPEDCFAVATPCEGEAHYSLYLSRFGRDIRAGQTVKARVRFAVAANVSDDQVIALYQQYMTELSRQSRPTDAGGNR